jgi:hypothetical protein
VLLAGLVPPRVELRGRRQRSRSLTSA